MSKKPKIIAGSAVATALVASSIVFWAGGRWSNPKAIPVCWVNPNDVTAEIKDSIRNHVTAQYSRSNVQFSGWDNCNSNELGKRDQIQVFFKRVHDWAKTSGSIGAGGGKSYIGPTKASLGGEDGQGTMMIAVGRNGAYPASYMRSWVIDQTLATAVHEFGHAVGLAHEHERADAPRCNDQAGNLKDGGTYKYVGAYDPQSIMNYCMNNNLNSLSNGDLAGIAELYPNSGGGGSSSQPKGSVRIVSLHSNKCVDIDNQSLDNSVQLQQYSCNGTVAQSFWIVNTGDGWINLINTKSGKCVDLRSSNKNDGAVVQQYSCNGTDAQKLRFDAAKSNGYARIRIKTSDKCLDVKDWSTADKGKIQQWTCGDGNNQYFGFPGN